MAAWVGRKRRGTTGVPWWKPISAAGNGSSVMHCARKPTSVKQPKWHSLSTSSTACWRWDARATSALHEAKRAWDHRVRRLIHATRSLCAALCLPARLLAGHRLRPLDLPSPIAMLAPPQARHLEPGAVATQEGPSTRIAMLPVPGKSSGNYGWTTFFLQRSFLERRSPLSASPKRGQRRRCATNIGAAARQGGLDDAGYVAYCALRSRLVSAVRRPRIDPTRNMPYPAGVSRHSRASLRVP